MADPIREEASIEIKASPEKVWMLVSDITRMGEWSPECRSCEWVGGATGPAVGAKFKGKNKAGVMRWSTTCEITVADPGNEFTFLRPGPDGGATWSYKFASTPGGGTRLNESCQTAKAPPLPLRILAPVLMPGRDLGRSIRTTLEGIKTAAEGSAR